MRKSFIPWLLAILLAALALALPPFAQPVQYHDFADQRACPGFLYFLPNCLDTASNLLFVLAGALGLLFLRGTAARHTFTDSSERALYALFFGAVVLIGLASGYYHLAPDNAGLAWDRAAIMLAFMTWFAAIIGERVGLQVGLRLLPPLLLTGLASVAWWYWSET
ncbi:MAG: hypothetical protein Q8J72_00360, partial [Rhodocyclaceae bacterium]|nr:hypothetical protein [Rhodocyclaceae bacterium]